VSLSLKIHIRVELGGRSAEVAQLSGIIFTKQKVRWQRKQSLKTQAAMSVFLLMCNQPAGH